MGDDRQVLQTRDEKEEAVSIPDLHFGRTMCARDKVDSRASSAPKVVLSRRRRRRTDTRKRNISLGPEVRPTYFRRARRVPTYPPSVRRRPATRIESQL